MPQNPGLCFRADILRSRFSGALLLSSAVPEQPDLRTDQLSDILDSTQQL
jgi:hypothetical protein